MDILKTFETKTGQDAVIRSITIDDLIPMHKWINEMSRENTFITFSGEEITLEEEREYLESLIEKINNNKVVSLVCYVGDNLVGKCDIEIKSHLRKRSAHVGRFGLSVAKEFRGEGIGFEIAKATIETAKKTLENLKLIELECFSTNIAALNLYRKLGFQEIGRMPGAIQYKGEYIDEVLMYLKLK